MTTANTKQLFTALEKISAMKVISAKKPITLAAAIQAIEKMQTLAMDALARA